MSHESHAFVCDMLLVSINVLRRFRVFSIFSNED